MRAPPELSSFAPPGLESLPAVPAARLTPEQLRGRALYDALCWSCHGRYGHGDGPVARGYPEALPDLGRIAAAQPVDAIVARMRQVRVGTGSSTAEPVWHELDPDQVRAAAAYVKSFAPSGARGNPAAGRLIYAVYCVHCHGARGAGDGRLARAMPRPPVDLRALDILGRSDRAFALIRAGGSPEHGGFMPYWRPVFSDRQLWDLISYLGILQASR